MQLETQIKKLLLHTGCWHYVLEVVCLVLHTGCWHYVLEVVCLVLHTGCWHYVLEVVCLVYTKSALVHHLVTFTTFVAKMTRFTDEAPTQRFWKSFKPLRNT